MQRTLLAIVSIVLTLNALESPEDSVAQLTLREKIGQLFVISASSNFEQPTEQLASAFIQ
jgi:hypothetical protein